MKTTLEAMNYLINKPHKNAEFINVENEDVRMFMCLDGTIAIDEMGSCIIAELKDEEIEDNSLEDESWILSFNPNA